MVNQSMVLFTLVRQDSDARYVMDPAKGNTLYVNDGSYNTPSMKYADVMLLVPVKEKHRGVCVTLNSSGDFGIFYKNGDEVQDPDYNGSNSFFILAMSNIHQLDSTWKSMREFYNEKIVEIVEQQKSKMPPDIMDLMGKNGMDDRKLFNLVKKELFELPDSFDEKYFGIKSIETVDEAQQLLDKHQVNRHDNQSTFTIDKNSKKAPMEPGAASGDEVFQPKTEETLDDFLKQIGKRKKNPLENIDLESILFNGDENPDPKQKEIFKKMMSDDTKKLLIDFMYKFMSITEDMDESPEEFLNNPLNLLQVTEIMFKCMHDIINIKK